MLKVLRNVNIHKSFLSLRAAVPLCEPLSVVFLLLLSLNSCSAQAQKPLSPSTDFYEGLKKKQAEVKTEAVIHFEKALDSPNVHAAAAAAAELMSLHYSGTEIRAETIRKIRTKAPALASSKAAGSWAMVLDALGTGGSSASGGEGGRLPAAGREPNREKILNLALNNRNRSPDEAIQYMLTELRAANALAGFTADTEAMAAAANNNMFSNAENAAIAGRIAVSLSRYREALIFFRMVMAAEPDLFFQYPELLGDLGRTFQYTATGREGIDLFLQWEKDFDKKYNNDNKYPEALIRFRLLFFAARIANQRRAVDQRNLPESIELFEKALPWALLLDPQIRGEQTDACIWYILNTSLAGDSGAAIKFLGKYIEHWQDEYYYSDVMDKLARELLIKRKWKDIIDIFALTSNRTGMTGAKFAWITGRAIQEGLLSRQEIEYARSALLNNVPSPSVQSDDIAAGYIRIAYNIAPFAAPPPGRLLMSFDGKALYYRNLAAAALGEPFFTPPAEPQPSAKPPAKTQAVVNAESDAMQFLLGFFRNGGAAKFAPRYIRMMESDLSPEELRQLAEALGKEGLYQESMRLVSLYMKLDAYQYDKRDLELLYPRPFSGQVNQYARETGIDPAKLYGLIRTESAFNADAISRSGAIGLTQLMPATAEEMAARILRRGGPDYTRKPDKDGADEISSDAESSDRGGLIASEVSVILTDPGANIHLGAVYLAYLDERMGDPLLALLAYNGGMNRVRRWRNSMPVKFPPDLFLETVEYAETRDYGRAVLGAAAMYKALYPVL